MFKTCDNDIVPIKKLTCPYCGSVIDNEEYRKICIKCEAVDPPRWRRDNWGKVWDGVSWLCNACYWQERGQPGDLEKKYLSPKQKVIICAMFIMKAYSTKSPVDLYNDKFVVDIWKDILYKCYEILQKFGLIELNSENLYNECTDPVGNLFRVNTDMLRRMTKGLFKSNGDMMYFLDISSEDDIKYLWKLITDEKKLNLDESREIYSSFSKIHNGNYLSAFDLNIHVFSKPKYDYIIKDIVLFVH